MRLRWNCTLRQIGPEGKAEPECSMCEDEENSISIELNLVELNHIEFD
jgi:hypothetical protein